MSRTYGQLRRTSDGWCLTKPEPHVSIRLKKIFPRLPKASAGPFFFPDTLDTAADLTWFIQRYNLAISDKDRRQLNRCARRYYKEQSDAELILSPTHAGRIRAGLKPGQALRPYQNVALDFIEKVRRMLLIDDIGLGKTYEGLGIALLPDALPLVVVVEPHLQDQWCAKAATFIDLPVHKVKGNTPYTLPSASIYIFKYTQLAPWVNVLCQDWIGAVVFDEVQQLRTGRVSAKGKAAGEICRHVPICVGLTGTLLYNYGIEAWNITDIIRPGLLGTRDEFLREWCGDALDSKGIVKDPDALGAYMRETHVMLRRTKRDVGQQAKQTRPHVEWVEPNTREVAHAEALAETLAIKTLTGGFHESGQAAREFDLKMREMTGIAKAVQTAAYVRMFLESGTPVLLFGYHHEVYRIWEKELAEFKPLFYTGRETQSQKERNKQAFINGESNLLIMSLRSGAGADGLQSRCSTVVMGEFDWSPKVHDQCIGRLDRDGQPNAVFVFYVATQFGSDPVMIDVLGLKETQSRGILDPGAGPITRQVDTDRLKKLATNYLAARGIHLEPQVADPEQMAIPCEDFI